MHRTQGAFPEHLDFIERHATHCIGVSSQIPAPSHYERRTACPLLCFFGLLSAGRAANGLPFSSTASSDWCWVSEERLFDKASGDSGCDRAGTKLLDRLVPFPTVFMPGATMGDLGEAGRWGIGDHELHSVQASLTQNCA